MDIHLVDVVLFVHIAVAVVAFAVAGLLLTALAQMRTADTVAVLRTWQRSAHRVEPWFPILALALLALGGWLIALSHREFRWSDGWVLTAVATLVIMEVYGGAVLAPNSKRLHTMIENIPDGPVPGHVYTAVMNPLVWAGTWGETGLAAGILFLMPTKPAGAWSIAIVAVVGLIAVVIGWRLSRTSSGQRRHQTSGSDHVAFSQH